VPVQIASINTLDRRAVRCSNMELPPAELVIVDEAHHAAARTWQRLINALANLQRAWRLRPTVYGCWRSAG